MMVGNRISLVVVFLLAFQISNRALADNMTIFLKSCAYGTAAGAALGLASLAWSENPSGRINNVARGASLGLYAGIGFGLYTVYGQSQKASNDYTQLPTQMWLTPVISAQNSRIEGAQLNWARISF
ncbi:MAG: hypothetical protein ACAH59_05810 [Pseudobdellovibrionaceae bacterium]